MIKIHWFIINILPILGFILAFIFIINLINEKKPPSSTFAWLLAIIFIPYISVPLYIIFGGRKIKHMIKKKTNLIKAKYNTNIEVDEKRKNKENLLNTDKNLFPIRYGCKINILETGKKAFDYLIMHIKKAKQCIYITTFVFGQDETGDAVLTALIEKIKEGVKICLLLDSLGSINISNKYLSDFKNAGGQYAFFMPMIHIPFRGRANLRNHRKIVIIDNEIAILGGMNIAQEYMGKSHYDKRWYDFSLAIRGDVVSDLYSVFYSDWKFAANKELIISSDNTTFLKKKKQDSSTQIPVHLVPSGPDVEGDTLHDAILTAIFTAKKRIWIVTPYFIPNEMLTKALCIAAARNVDVRLIIPLASNHKLADLIRKNYLLQIQIAGAKIYNFKPGMLHAKLIIIDNLYSIIGSANMDMRSLFLNYEIALFIYSKEILKQLEKWVNELIKDCDIGIKKSNIISEFFEKAARLLAPLL